MSINVDLHLYSILREKLPAAMGGHTRLSLEEGASLADVFSMFGFSRRAVISVNGEHETDLNRALCDGDEIRIFSSTSGG